MRTAFIAVSSRRFVAASRPDSTREAATAIRGQASQAGSDGGAVCLRPRRTRRTDVPRDQADAAEHDDEGQQGGEDQAGDAGAVPEHLDGVQKGPDERVGRIDRAGVGRALLAQEDRQGAVGRGLAQRLELGAKLLDGQLHVVDAVLHGQHLVDVLGGGEEPHEASLDGAVVSQARLEIDVLRRDILARGGDALDVAEAGEALQGGVETALGHAQRERGIRVRGDGGRRLVVGRGDCLGAER